MYHIKHRFISCEPLKHLWLFCFARFVSVWQTIMIRQFNRSTLIDNFTSVPIRNSVLAAAPAVTWWLSYIRDTYFVWFSVFFSAPFFALFISFGIPSHFILCRFIKCSVQALALAHNFGVAKVVKFVYFFISLFLCVSFFFCSASIARSAILASRPSVHVCFYSFCNESFYTGNVFHKVVYVSFSISFVRSFSHFLPVLCICRCRHRHTVLLPSM